MRKSSVSLKFETELWVVLDRSRVYEYRDSSVGKPESAHAVIDLKFASVREGRGTDRRFGQPLATHPMCKLMPRPVFEIVTPTQGRRVYQATSDHEMKVSFDGQTWLILSAMVVRNLQRNRILHQWHLLRPQYRHRQTSITFWIFRRSCPANTPRPRHSWSTHQRPRTANVIHSRITGNSSLHASSITWKRRHRSGADVCSTDPSQTGELQEEDAPVGGDCK